MNVSEQQEDIGVIHLQIGELARRAGVTIRTVRYYEEKGLLLPSSITSGGIRLYGQKDVNRLMFIRRLRTLGLDIDEIKMSLGMPIEPDKKVRVRHTLELLNMQMTKTEEAIARLSDLQKEVEHSLQMVTRCVSCAARQCPPNCPSVNHIL